MTSKKSKKNDIESALDELESLVEKMESDELTLEESLKSFEKGIQLIASCQKTLKSAEQKIQKLNIESGKEALVDFEEE